MAETLAERAARFAKLGRALLPKGIAWARHTDAKILDVLTAFLYEYARVEVQADTFRAEMDPSETELLLAEWERALGLPDECGGATTVEGRRAAILTRLTDSGTNTEARIREAIERFDSETTLAGVQHPTQFEVGTDGGGAGQPIGSDGWAHVVTLVLATASSTIETAALQCILEDLKRAHGYFLFDYWTPADLPGRLLHLDAGLGVTESAGVLTAWVDQSPAAETITINGSPAYNYVDYDANNRPSVDLTAAAAYVQAAGVTRADIQFVALVSYGDLSVDTTQFNLSGTGADDTFVSFVVPGDIDSAWGGSSPAESLPAELRRLVIAGDGVTSSQYNDEDLGVLGTYTGSSTGVRVGTDSAGTAAGSRMCEIILCDQVPSAEELAYLQAYWRAKYLNDPTVYLVTDGGDHITTDTGARIVL